MQNTSLVYDPDPQQQLRNEERRATKLLKGKVINRIYRHRPEEVVIDFEDGTRFSFDWRVSGLDLSITGDFEENE